MASLYGSKDGQKLVLFFCKEEKRMNIILVVFVLFVIVPVCCILYAYVIKPKKSIKEGLSDWFHESDEDV